MALITNHYHQSSSNCPLQEERTFMDAHDTEQESLRSLGESVFHSCHQHHNSERLDSLRCSVGDFGVALFAPLLDLDDSRNSRSVKDEGTLLSHSRNKEPKAFHEEKSSVGNLTLQTDPDSWMGHEELSEDEQDESVYVLPETMEQLTDCPRILSPVQMQQIKRFLPRSVRDYPWERCFCIGLHGDSFITMVRNAEPFTYSIVVIKTTTGNILGGFACQKWSIRDEKGHNRHDYYGTGQSFVFASDPDDLEQTHKDPSSSHLHVYKWTGDNDYCQICDSDRRVMCMGGVGEFGWIVSDDFTCGQTGWCGTFGNPPLSSQHTFQIADFEIYGLTSPVLLGSFVSHHSTETISPFNSGRTFAY